MNKKLILSLAAAGLLASCAVDEQPGSTTALSDNNTIAFNMQTASQSRAQESGNTAANTLGKMFIVWGEKNENQNSGTKADDADLVFKNYVVKYTKDSKSVSNTAGWEYVGNTPYAETEVSPAITGAQTIKYWDDNANSYTFTAISAKAEDIKPSGEGATAKVIIKKNTSGTDVYSKGYTVNVKSGASVDNIYFSDRNYIGKTQGSSSFDHSKAVSMSFRNFMSKIRFGIYESVSGYKVVITGLKYNNGTEHKSTGEDKNFGVDGNFVVAGENTQYTVTYEDNNSSKENKAKVALVGTPATQTYLNTTGTQWLSTSETSPVGTTANAPTWDNTAAGTYTTIMPNPGNEKEMTLTISYDLYSEDTGEKISVDYKTVKVPAEYCQWKSNYAYTYLFKITDQNTGLSPITFDAVVETEDNATWEDITTVDDPSITTFATTSENKIVTGKSEYEGGNSIYAVVMDKENDVYKTADLSSSNIKLYTVTSTNQTAGGAVQEITEGSVANCIANGSTTDGSTTMTDANGCTMTATAVTINATGNTAPCFVTSVPAEDGTTKSISALKWIATANTTYAIEYIKGTDADTKKYYKIVKVAAATSNGSQDSQTGNGQ